MIGTIMGGEGGRLWVGVMTLGQLEVYDFVWMMTIL